MSEQRACRVLGIEKVKPAQKQAIEAVKSRKNVAVFLPTGTGKSFCYQAPALILNSSVVVVSPLIALMKDQVQGLKEKKVKAIYICGENKHQALSEMKKSPEIIYMSPEQAIAKDVLTALRSIRRTVCLLAIDEVEAERIRERKNEN